MLTPVDQPLDKLEDLTQEEMYDVASTAMSSCRSFGFIQQREHEGLV